MAAKERDRCEVQVGQPPGYWYFHTCNRPVKHVIVTREGTKRGVCGVHKRMHDRISLDDFAFDKRGST